MFSVMSVAPFLLLLLWVGGIIYLVVLATRLVNAVEPIASVVTQRSPDVTE